MRKSWGSTKPKGAMKVKAGLSVGLGRIASLSARAHYRPLTTSL